MKKILFCASTVSHINNFHLPYLKAFKEMGYEVHVAANEAVQIQWADKVHAISFDKQLISSKNILAVAQSIKLLKGFRYDKLSANTTLASVIMRIAALFIKERPYIFNIVHGYLFNINSGLRKYVYLIPEKIAAKVSDTVMVMNLEDLGIAEYYRLYKSKLVYIDGMGVDSSRYRPVEQEEREGQKKRLGLNPGDFTFVYAAEFSARKNQMLLINAFAKSGLEKAHLLLAGNGKTFNECKERVNYLNLMDKVHFLGYVNDIPMLYSASDVVVSPSLIEGLPFNIIEALGCGLPVVASDIKGHRDLIDHQVNGLLYHSQDEEALIASLKEIYGLSAEQRKNYGQAGSRKAVRFTLTHVFDQVMDIYRKEDQR